MRTLLLAALVVLTASCTVDDIDFTGKGCSAEAPCPDGLTCSAGKCIRKPTCTPAFEVSGFQRRWETPNSVRWSWTLLGPAESFVQYKLILAASPAELEAARQLALAGENDVIPGGSVWTQDDNPELGHYELRLSGATDPVTETTTDQLLPGTEYRALLQAYDAAGCVFETETALALTPSPSSLAFTIFDEQAHPQGNPRPALASIQTDASQAHEGDSYVLWPGWPDDGSVPDGSYENIGVFQLGTVPEQHYPLLDFSVAYLERALAIDGPPLAAWGEIRLILGPPGGGCSGITPTHVKPYVYRPGHGYHLLQVPLDEFRVQEVQLDEATFESRSVCEVSVGRSWTIGESVRVDSIRLRW